MGRKYCVGGCRSNDDREKVSVYGFPTSDVDKLQRWLSVLPNVIDPKSVTRNMGVCAKHWEADAPMEKVNGKFRPSSPPDVFTLFVYTSVYTAFLDKPFLAPAVTLTTNIHLVFARRCRIN